MRSVGAWLTETGILPCQPAATWDRCSPVHSWGCTQQQPRARDFCSSLCAPCTAQEGQLPGLLPTKGNLSTSLRPPLEMFLRPN